MCKVYRMKLFAKNLVCARSRFWYFMGRLCREKKALRVKNFGFWFRYESRTGTHNAYKEFRALKLTDAVNQLYRDMAGRSRAKSSAIQILKTAELEPKDCKRPVIKQMHSKTLKFPLPHRVPTTAKAYKTTFKAARPNTYY